MKSRLLKLNVKPVSLIESQASWYICAVLIGSKLSADQLYIFIWIFLEMGMDMSMFINSSLKGLILNK